MVNKELFLAIMKAALQGKTVNWDKEVNQEEFIEIIKMSQEQNVLPMVYEATVKSSSFQVVMKNYAKQLKYMTMQSVLQQIQQTDTFLHMYKDLQNMGLEPILVKGLLLRNIYPNPDERSSGDEDIYIPTNSYNTYKEALNKANMFIADWDKETEETNHELSYIHASGQLRIEVHKDLFDNELVAFKGMNDLFKDSFKNSILININGVNIRTMNYTDHMIFLIVHAFKHFVSSGFGIRQLCDIVMYGNTYGKEIDWYYVNDRLTQVNADKFAASLFNIGEQYLGFDVGKANYPEVLSNKAINGEHLLMDLFDAGVFGGSDMSRKHSSTITINAVNDQKEGKKSRSIIRTIFPTLKEMQAKYNYLMKYPVLLPVAWITRIVRYRKESKNTTNNDALESLKIGNKRVELLKEYGILK